MERDLYDYLCEPSNIIDDANDDNISESKHTFQLVRDGVDIPNNL